MITFLLSALLVSIPASAAETLTDGSYQPMHSNNPSVCPQEVKTLKTEGRLTALRVYYVGDCYRQGPFEYYCADVAEGLVCSYSDVEFVIQDETHFLWRNNPYGIRANFERVGN